MQWQVILPADEQSSGEVIVHVEAENWLSALRLGLKKRGINGQLFSNLSCDIKADQSVEVKDFVTNKIFHLRPADTKPAGVASHPPAAARRDAKVDFGQVPNLPSGLPPHELFYTRDEVPDDGSEICYRERLIAVASNSGRENAARLAQAYFHQARAMGAINGTKLFVSVQVFDHKFAEQSQRPAVAALTWKQWSPRAPKVIFPLSGEEAIAVSVSTVPEAVPASAPAPLPVSVPAAPAATPVQRPSAAPLARPSAVPLARPSAAPLARPSAPPARPSAPPARRSSVPPTPPPAAFESVPPAPPAPVLDLVTPKAKAAQPAVAPIPKIAPLKQPEPAPVSPKKVDRHSSSPGHKSAKAMGIDDRMVIAFERMHEIFGIRDHDQAARFVIDLAHELVEAEAGSCMLISPGRYELYVAAATGPSTEALLGRKMSFTKGIVGFATRTSSVVTCSDPSGDPRFDNSIDVVSGFTTRSILVAPIQYEGHTLGAIELINSPRKGGFSQDESNILSYIGGAFGEFVQTSLPSREADFSDKDFLPHGHRGTRPSGAPPRPHQSTSTAKAASPLPLQPKRDSVPPAAPAPRTSRPHKAPAPQPSKGKKKKSKKR